MNRETILGRIFEFLTRNGISIIQQELPSTTFLPGIRLEYGALAIDKEKLKYPGDILHEAGHIACMAPSKRKTAYADAGDDMGEEIASHAWSYAAALACKIPPEFVFHEEGYKGSAETLCDHYKEGGTNGVPLLQWFNMTHMPDLRKPDIIDPTCFPTMHHWLRLMDDPTEFWRSQPE